MNTEVLEALALVLVASMLNAAYTLPMKATRKWAWENTWFAFSVLGLVVVPTLITAATVPNLAHVYAQTPAGTLAAMAFFGLLWGICMVLFGLAVPIAGLAISFALSLGTSAACGSLLALLMKDPGRVLTRSGIAIAAGLALIVAGVWLCGAAGRLRERLEGNASAAHGSRFVKGFVYAILSGVLGSMLNLGLAAGGQLQQLAAQQGASTAMMSNAVWLPCIYAGFLPGVIYCWHLMRKNRTTPLLWRAARWYYWLMAALMGAFWFGSIVAYSLAAVKLGELGPAIGWPLFMSAVVIVSMFNGLVTGEWSRGGPRPIRIMSGGIACLVGAIVALTLAAR